MNTTVLRVGSMAECGSDAARECAGQVFVRMLRLFWFPKWTQCFTSSSRDHWSVADWAPVIAPRFGKYSIRTAIQGKMFMCAQSCECEILREQLGFGVLRRLLCRHSFTAALLAHGLSAPGAARRKRFGLQCRNSHRLRSDKSCRTGKFVGLSEGLFIALVHRTIRRTTLEALLD